MIMMIMINNIDKIGRTITVIPNTSAYKQIVVDTTNASNISIFITTITTIFIITHIKQTIPWKDTLTGADP